MSSRNRKQDQNWIKMIKNGLSDGFVVIQYNPRQIGDVVEVKGNTTTNCVYLVDADASGNIYKNHPDDIVDVSVDGSKEKTLKAKVIGYVDKYFLELAEYFDVYDSISLEKYRYHGEFIVFNPDADERESKGEGNKPIFIDFTGQGNPSPKDIDPDEAKDFGDGDGDGSGDSDDDKEKDSSKKSGQSGSNSDGSSDSEGKTKNSDGKGPDDKENDSSENGSSSSSSDAKDGKDNKDEGKGSGSRTGDAKPDDNKSSPKSRRRIVTKIKYF